MEKTNLIELLRSAKIEDLGLPAQIFLKLQDQNLVEFQKIYIAVQAYHAFGQYSLVELTDGEFKIIDQCITNLLIAKGLMRHNGAPAREGAEKKSPTNTPAEKHSRTANVTRSALVAARHTRNIKEPDRGRNIPIPVKLSVHASALSLTQPLPLSDWEKQLAPQLGKVDLVGEIPISKKELEDISHHLSRLFYNRSEQAVFEVVEQYYPATFLVFMVGQGIYGYKGGDFWLAYEQALRKPIDHAAFGRFFEKLLQQFGKPQPQNLPVKPLRYVSLILSHGGIAM
jgi:hypothetical protein